MAIATSAGALTFLAGQRASGRTPKEVHECHDQAALLEGVQRELDALCEASRDMPEEARVEVERARAQLEEAILSLRRGADLVV